jgi:hypothetical protein
LPESAKRKLKRKAYQAAPEITVETSARDGAAGVIGAGGGGGNERKQLPIGISIARNGQERLKNRELLAGGVKMGWSISAKDFLARPRPAAGNGP